MQYSERIGSRVARRSVCCSIAAHFSIVVGEEFRRPATSRHVCARLCFAELVACRGRVSEVVHCDLLRKVRYDLPRKLQSLLAAQPSVNFCIRSKKSVPKERHGNCGQMPQRMAIKVPEYRKKIKKLTWRGEQKHKGAAEERAHVVTFALHVLNDVEDRYDGHERSAESHMKPVVEVNELHVQNKADRHKTRGEFRS